jgi:hypothetical protein
MTAILLLDKERYGMLEDPPPPFLNERASNKRMAEKYIQFVPFSGTQYLDILGTMAG